MELLNTRFIGKGIQKKLMTCDCALNGFMLKGGKKLRFGLVLKAKRSFTISCHDTQPTERMERGDGQQVVNGPFVGHWFPPH